MVKIYYEDKFMDNDKDTTVCITNLNLGLNDVTEALKPLLGSLSDAANKSVGVTKKNPADKPNPHVAKTIAKSRAHSIALANSITQMKKAQHSAEILSRRIAEAITRLSKEQIKAQGELSSAKDATNSDEYGNI